MNAAVKDRLNIGHEHNGVFLLPTPCQTWPSIYDANVCPDGSQESPSTKPKRN